MAPQSRQRISCLVGLPEVVGAFDPTTLLSSWPQDLREQGICGRKWGSGVGGSGRASVHWGPRGWLGRDNECLHPKFSPGRSHVYTDTPDSNKYNKYRYTLTKPAQPRGMCAVFPVNKV